MLKPRLASLAIILLAPLASQAAIALGVGLAGLAAYGGLVKLLHIEAAEDFVTTFRRRLRRRVPG